MDVVDKWIDIFEKDLGIKCNRSIVYNLYKEGYALELDDKGFALCIAHDDLLYNKVCSEIMIYLKPEHRNYRNFKKLINFIEEIAKENECTHVQCGAFTGYSDDKVIKMYRRMGYNTASVRKEL